MPEFKDNIVNARLTELRRSEEEKVIQTLAPQLGLEYINLHGYTINPEAVSLVPETTAREAELIAFDVSHTSISVAMKNPNNARTLQALEELEQRARLPIIPFLCSTDSLLHGWKRYADQVSSTARTKGVFDIDEADIERFISEIKRKEDVAIIMDKVGNTNNARRVTEVLELVFAGAIALKASDIHIEPEEKAVRLRYRLDGMLYDIYDIDRYIYERLMSRLKLLAGMTLNHKQEAQDGRFTFAAIGRDVEIRASVIPGAAGESMVMRILDPSVASFNLDKIDLNPILRAVVQEELKKPNGLIITTGPTGSGKTTALYAFLRATHEEGVKIITIENPVEYKIEGIVQTQTGDDYTFASGLRAILRQDPDIIMVGEIRDKEVAETAIHAAQTGHLVFSTLHTNSAVGGFPRLIDLGIEPRILGSAITLLLGQRLVRRLCTECKQPYTASPEEAGVLGEIMRTHPTPTTIPSPLTLYKPAGCPVCGGTGYKGRMGIFEAIRMDKAVEEVVIRDPREHLILEAAEPQGIPTMVEDGAEKVLRGETSLAELERVVELPKLLENNAAEEKPPTDTDTDTFLAHVVN
jgi:type II secretory ATPase GspE/PulE/Tfp pilus assembly ATPase PilB-like protein